MCRVLQESYPSTPPIWFVDSDDPSLAEVLERLEDVRKGSTLVSRSGPSAPPWTGPLPRSPGVHGQADCLSQVTFLSLWSAPQLLQQLKRLICDLCRLYNLPQHPDVEMLDQPLPAGPITQERKVLMEEKKMSLCELTPQCFVYSKESSAFQHVHSDEVTSEESEEEEMGEVTTHDAGVEYLPLNGPIPLHPVCY